jgi:AcrR family transcriptional regulator
VVVYNRYINVSDAVMYLKVMQTTPTAAKPPRVTKRRGETRARLLDAAFRVFADKGFGRARIEDVCAEAGYTRGAFYSQFGSLEELFFTLYDERATLIAGQLATAMTAPPEPADWTEVLDRISQTLLLERDWLLIKTDFLMHAARHPEVAERLATHRDQLRAAVEQRLADTGNDVHEALGTVAMPPGPSSPLTTESPPS